MDSGSRITTLLTTNPLGVLPDPNVTDIVVGKEISEEKLKLVPDWKEEGYKQIE